MRAGQFQDEERKGWLELLMNHKRENKRGFDPALLRAGSVQDLKRMGGTAGVQLKRLRKWKDDSDTTYSASPKEALDFVRPSQLREDEEDSNLGFHLFLLEYFWQLSAFDHGRFRTILFHLMATGIFDMSYERFQALLLDKKATSAAARNMPPGLHSLLRNILKEYKSNGAERLTHLLGHDPSSRAGLKRGALHASKGAAAAAGTGATAGALALGDPGSPPDVSGMKGTHGDGYKLQPRSRFALRASSRAALPRLPRQFSSPCLPMQILCPNPSSSALPPLALPYASPYLPFTSSRYGEEFVEDSTLGTGGFGSVFKAHRILDGRVYAIKKIHFRVSQRSTRKLEKVVREVQALASLDHVNICRYYNAWIEPIQAHDLEEMLRKAENSAYGASEDSTLSNEQLRNPLDATELLSTSESVSSPLVEKSLLMRGRIAHVDDDGWKESAFSGDRNDAEGEDSDYFERGGPDSSTKTMHDVDDCDDEEDEDGDDKEEEEDEVRNGSDDGESDDYDDIFEQPPEGEEIDAAELEEASVADESNIEEDDGEDDSEEVDDDDDDDSVSGFDETSQAAGFFPEDAMDFESFAPTKSGSGASRSRTSKSSRSSRHRRQKAKAQAKKTKAKAKRSSGSGSRGLKAGALLPRLSRSPEGQLVPWRPAQDSDSDSSDADAEPPAPFGEANNNGAAPLLTHTLYIQMQCYDDVTLQHWLARDGRKVVREENLHIFKQMVEALRHVHSKHIIHRDLKPANVFLCDGIVKLGDFGLAKRKVLFGGGGDGALEAAGEHGLGETNALLQRHHRHSPQTDEEHTAGCGTLSYAAPEQRMAGGKYSEKVDIYALGIILFELFHPFGTATERMLVLSDLREKAVLPPHITSLYPDEARVIMQMLSSRPEERPSAEELLAMPLLSQHKHEESVQRLNEELESKNRLIEKQLDELAQRDSKIRELEERIARLTCATAVSGGLPL